MTIKIADKRAEKELQFKDVPNGGAFATMNGVYIKTINLMPVDKDKEIVLPGQSPRTGFCLNTMQHDYIHPEEWVELVDVEILILDHGASK